MISKLDGDRCGEPAALPLASEREIVERIYSAVIEHRLPPGTKLPENTLCQTFGVSRARIRRVLLMLAEREIVDLRSNRGAFVASPSPAEARNIFQARLTIEPTVVGNAIQQIDDAQVAALRLHVEHEMAASRLGDRHEAIRLSGRFHVKLAEVANNPVLTRIIEELVARTSLIIALFGSSRISSCSEDEHRLLLEAIVDRDMARASDQMVHHLKHIESELDLAERNKEPVDVRTALTP